jgi:hypothetical protein
VKIHKFALFYRETARHHAAAHNGKCETGLRCQVGKIVASRITDALDWLHTADLLQIPFSESSMKTLLVATFLTLFACGA